jgi:hypothetical protein
MLQGQQVEASESVTAKGNSSRPTARVAVGKSFS